MNFLKKITEILKKLNGKLEKNNDNMILDLTKDRIVLVMASGGLKGSTQLGELLYLQEIGVLDKVSGFVGSSVGSINLAGILSLGINGLKDMWLNISKQDIFLGELKENETKFIEVIKKCESFGDLVIIIEAIERACKGKKPLDNSPLKKLLTSVVDPQKMIDSSIDWAICTNNITKLRREIYTNTNILENKVVDAIMKSSSAFPVFPLYKDEEGTFIDGGYYESAHNFDVAYNILNADKTIVLDLSQNDDKECIKDKNCLYINGYKGNFLDVSNIEEKINYGYELAKKSFKNVKIIK